MSAIVLQLPMMDKVIFAWKQDTTITFLGKLHPLTIVGIFGIRVQNQVYKSRFNEKIVILFSILQNFRKQLTWEVISHLRCTRMLWHK